MDKQTVVVIQRIITQTLEEECHTDIGSTMTESWKHYATWNKPDTKGHVCERSTTGKSTETENRKVVVSGWEVGEEMGSDYNG